MNRTAGENQLRRCWHSKATIVETSRSLIVR